MGGLLGRSQAPPALAVAEAGAMVFERLMLARLRTYRPMPAFALTCDDALSMLVRHPARDAWAQTEWAPGAWPAIAAQYAPDHDWSAVPAISAADAAAPERPLAYAVATALAAVLAPALARDLAMAQTFMDWMTAGEAATLGDLSPLLPAPLDDPALYEAAYESCLEWMGSPPDDNHRRPAVIDAA